MGNCAQSCNPTITEIIVGYKAPEKEASASAINISEVPETLSSLGFRIYIQNIVVAVRHHNNNSAAHFQRSNKLDSSLAQ